MQKLHIGGTPASLKRRKKESRHTVLTSAHLIVPGAENPFCCTFDLRNFGVAPVCVFMCVRPCLVDFKVLLQTIEEGRS